MLAFLAAIPGLRWIGDVVNNITTSWFNAKVRMVQARIGGDRDVAVKLVTAASVQAHENTSRLGIIASNKLLTVLLIAFAIPLVGYEWQVIVLNKMLHYGSVDPIKGQVSDWANQIIWFLFGSPTVLGIGKMWFSRNKSGE